MRENPATALEIDTRLRELLLAPVVEEVVEKQVSQEEL
jgi:hypothetical protein